MEGREVHQHGAAGIGDVGEMSAAVGAAGEVPEEEGVDGAEEKLSLVGEAGGVIDGVGEPVEFWAGEGGGGGAPGSAAVSRVGWGGGTGRGGRPRGRLRGGACSGA